MRPMVDPLDTSVAESLPLASTNYVSPTSGQGRSMSSKPARSPSSKRSPSPPNEHDVPLLPGRTAIYPPYDHAGSSSTPYSPTDPTSALRSRKRAYSPPPRRSRFGSLSQLTRSLDFRSSASSAWQNRLPYPCKVLIHPRFILLVFCWAGALWLVHVFLLPLPVPSYSPSSEAMTSLTSYDDVDWNAEWTQGREGDDDLDSVDPRWRPLRPLKPPDPPFPRLRPTRFLPNRCMHQWFMSGETDCTREELGEETKLDATWFWVNGTDPRWERTLEYWKAEDGVKTPGKHYREQNELMYSMRSVLAALPGKIRSFNLISADYPFDLTEDLALMEPSTLAKLEAEVERTAHQHKTASGRDRDKIPHYDAKHPSGLTISDELAQHLETQWRVAQTPTWLDFSRRRPSHPSRVNDSAVELLTEEQGLSSETDSNGTEVNYPALRYAVHSEVFHLPTGLDEKGKRKMLGESEWKEDQWRAKALPSFNSMSIEAKIGFVPGLVSHSDVTLTLNDDFFIMKRLAVSDFYSPFYGPVIRLDPNFYMQVKPVLDPDIAKEGGENGGLFHANWLISQRFPKRLRHYASHVPKVIQKALHHEANLMFPEAFAESGMRRFREKDQGPGDLQSLWLTIWLGRGLLRSPADIQRKVERWREALLWTFSVAGLGTIGEFGMWDSAGRQHLCNIFGLTEDDEDVVSIEVKKGQRSTLKDWRSEQVFQNAGWEEPKSTALLFPSIDGHLPPILRPGQSFLDNTRCFIDLAKCFGEFWSEDRDVPAVEMFERLAFVTPECGDCMINALVTASGSLGLSAFFPPNETYYETPAWRRDTRPPAYIPPPHLPVTSTWEEADFTLENVMAESAAPGEAVHLRTWCMKLLSRYQYVSARSNTGFYQLINAANTASTLRPLRNNRAITFLGINDDIESEYDQVRAQLLNFMNFRWPNKAVWERDWDPEKDHIVLDP